MYYRSFDKTFTEYSTWKKTVSKYGYHVNRNKKGWFNSKQWRGLTIFTMCLCACSLNIIKASVRSKRLIYHVPSVLNNSTIFPKTSSQFISMITVKGKPRKAKK